MERLRPIMRKKACARELGADKSVSDATYARKRARFGDKGVIDLAGINGHYTLLAMEMNIARTAAPDVGDATLPSL